MNKIREKLQNANLKSAYDDDDDKRKRGIKSYKYPTYGMKVNLSIFVVTFHVADEVDRLDG